MNKVLIIGICVMTFLNSCTTSPRKDTSNNSFALPGFGTMEEKHNPQKIADSIVHLSFSGITLGTSFTNSISKAKSNHKIIDVIISKDKDGGKSARCKTELFFPNRENSENVEFFITSFQDTITSLLIISTDFDTKEEIENLYKNKYGVDFAIQDGNCDSWNDRTSRNGNSSYLWKFKNQSVRLTEFYTETRENYVKDASMISPENRYGVRYNKYFESISILYSDIKQCEKVEKYKTFIEEANLIKQNRIDSIKNKHRKKRIAEQDF